MLRFLTILWSLACICSCEEKSSIEPKGTLQIIQISVGNRILSTNTPNPDIPINQTFQITFSTLLDSSLIKKSIKFLESNAINTTDYTFGISEGLSIPGSSILSLTPLLNANTTYQLSLDASLRGLAGETFPGITVSFSTVPESIQVTEVQIDGEVASGNVPPRFINRDPSIEITFSHPILQTLDISSLIRLSGGGVFIATENKWSVSGTKINIVPLQTLKAMTKYQINISSELKGTNQEVFSTYSFPFFTDDQGALSFPILSDDELLTKVQKQTFNYFWEFAEPVSGMARERNSSGNLITSGGSGFGIMNFIVGMERGFITREQGLQRMDQVLTFLENADRFHGAWPHWMNGTTGKVIPFSTKDNGADLVETSFLIQGLLTFRQYMDTTLQKEKEIVDRINLLWKGVEWNWFRKNNENVLYWHWSPQYNWDMNFAMYGYFEQQITYLLAVASPTFSVPKEVYTNGYGRNGAIVKNNLHYGINLPLENPAPLFWVHYSYLGLDPHFQDAYANYWEQNVNATRINQAYCIANPKGYYGYSDKCWGLTSSDNASGYAAHSPYNDLGFITPTAALSSFPYTPEESMKALHYFYYTLGDRLWGPYGFYDAFNLTTGWTASSYLAIDQGPITVMIENYRTGLLWKLFMSCPEIHTAFSQLDITITP